MLYAANTSSQTIGTSVNFGSEVVRTGCKAKLSGGNVVINGVGAYKIGAMVTIDSTAAGTGILTLYKNGVAIPGASSSVTLAAAGADSVYVFGAVDNNCCCDTVITAVVTGATGTISNAAIEVDR